jgi:threonine dehydrogenase-like Zn-dependent dehydrogenase
MKTMNAAVFCGSGRIEVQRLPIPKPAANEVAIRLEGCGVCASNLPVWAGKPWFSYPLTPGSPGHEGWGEIAEVGDGISGFSVGDRVTFLSHKAYAQYDTAPASALIPLPKQFAGLPLPGEPLACVMNIFRRSDIGAGQNVAVIGVGFMGALLIQLAARAGANVIALTRRPYALEIARMCGAAHAVSCADMHAAIGSVMELTGGRGCERVIEAAGEQASLDLASAATAEGGRLVIAGYHQDGPRTIDMQQWNWRGLDVINAHERDANVVVRGMREAMQAVADGRLDPFPLLTHSFALDKLERAFTAMRDRPDGFLKATVAL